MPILDEDPYRNTHKMMTHACSAERNWCEPMLHHGSAKSAFSSAASRAQQASTCFLSMSISATLTLAPPLEDPGSDPFTPDPSYSSCTCVLASFAQRYNMDAKSAAANE